MVSETAKNRSCYHLAGESYVTFCGRKEMLARDYVEVKDGNVLRIGEGGQVLEIIRKSDICKKCFASLTPTN